MIVLYLVQLLSCKERSRSKTFWFQPPEMVIIWAIACATWEAGAAAVPELHLSGLATLTGNRLSSATEYLAVPYVQPPVGPLRFKPPRALEHDNQIQRWDGTVLGPACPQNPEGGLGPEPNQSEDCLQVTYCAVESLSTPPVTRCLPPAPAECVGTTCHETSVERVSHLYLASWWRLDLWCV